MTSTDDITLNTAAGTSPLVDSVVEAVTRDGLSHHGRGQRGKPLHLPRRR
jgi:hypothetical protein